MSKKGRQRRQAYLQSLQEKKVKSDGKSPEKKIRKRKKEPAVIIVLRILMLAVFIYSGFYYGGTLILSIFGKYIDPVPPAWVGRCILFGTLLTAAGVAAEFFKKHLISFIAVFSGVLLYLKGVDYLISYIQKRLDEFVVDESLTDMDRVYMLRHYPIAACALISFIILVISFVLKIKAKKKAQYLKDTAPVRSIVD